jgi:hypothetical protein
MSRVVGICVVVCAVVLAAACTQRTTETLPPLATRASQERSPLGDAHGDVISSMFGDAVAVVNGAWGPKDSGRSENVVATAAFGPDDRWRELPTPDLVAGPRLLGTDEAVMMLGVDGRRLQLQALGRRDAEWLELDIPDAEFTTETEFFAVAAGSEYAVFGVSSHLLAVAPDGTVRLAEHGGWSERRDHCVVGNQLVELRTRHEDRGDGIGSAAEPAGVVTLDLDDPDRGWTGPGAVPFVGMLGRFVVCGPSGPIVLGRGEELSYDVTRARWERREVDPPSSLGPLSGRPPNNGSTVLDDGTVVAVDAATDHVLRRDPDGNWSDTGELAEAVAGSRAHAYLQMDDRVWRLE